NVWSIVDGTPAGVTLHYIDEHVDTGDIIAQREVLVDAADTGGTLYNKLERAAEALFCETWPLVRSGKAPRIPQGSGGTYHRVRDVEAIDEIDLDRPYKAGDLINILRARSFPPHRGAYFRDGNRKVYIEVSLISEQGGGMLTPPQRTRMSTKLSAVIALPAVHYGVEELQEALYATGISEGDIVFFQVCIDALGAPRNCANVDDTCETLFRALRNTVGPKGTILA